MYKKPLLIRQVAIVNPLNYNDSIDKKWLKKKTKSNHIELKNFAINFFKNK